MSSYYTPGKVVIGRHWKRPKPRVYECNIRDAERFYQQTYRDYLDAKEYAAERASEDRSHLDEEPTASKWTMRRSNSFIDQETDHSSRDYSRDDSLVGRRNQTNLTTAGRDDGYQSKVRASSVNKLGRESPECDVASLEQRRNRIRKLREELGLSTDSGSEVSYTPSRISARQTSPVETKERRGRTSEQTSSYSSKLSSTRSDGNDANSFGRKYQTNESVNSRYNSKLNYQEEPIYGESRQERKTVTFASLKDDSSSFKPSTRSFNRRITDEEDFGCKENSHKSKTSSVVSKSDSSCNGSRDNGLGEGDDEDDELLSNIKKKFLTSDEILERIKKLDTDL